MTSIRTADRCDWTYASLTAHYAAVRRRLDPPRPRSKALPPPPPEPKLIVDADKVVEAVIAAYPPKAFSMPLPHKRKLLWIVLAALVEDHEAGSAEEAFEMFTTSRRFKREVALRQHAFYWMRKLTAVSLPEIGRLSNNRDHTTVLHGIRRCEEELAADKGRFADVHAKIAASAAALGINIREWKP